MQKFYSTSKDIAVSVLYIFPSQASSGLAYSDVGPHIPPAPVTPPASDNIVQYTALIHDQNIAKDSEGMTSLYLLLISSSSLNKFQVQTTPQDAY